MLTNADRVALVLALAALPFVYHHAWSGNGAADSLVVSAAGQTLRFALHPDREITVQGNLGPSRIEIRDRRARFVDSPCARKVCVLSGWHSHAGELAACLPNGVSLTLSAVRPAYDAVNF
jgi:hypothetical protein